MPEDRKDGPTADAGAPPEKRDPRLSRSAFLKNCLWGLGNLGMELFGDTLETIEKLFPETIRPPGARPEEEFLSLCTRCGACLAACSFHAIRKVPRPGSFDEGTPHLVLRDGHCRMCRDFPCIAACPTGALKPPAQGTSPRIGIARVTEELCLRPAGNLCNACDQACFPRAKAIDLPGERFPPRVDPEKCTGCGACESVCPVDPEKAIQVFSTK